MIGDSVIVHLINGVVAGVIYALIGWLRNNSQAKAALKAGEMLSEKEIEQIVEFARFNPGEFLTTVIQGALVGFLAAGLELAGIFPFAESLDLLVKLGLMVVMRRVSALITNYLGVMR